MEIPYGCTNEWDLGGLGDDYVVVDVSVFSSPPFFRPDQEAELPLELDRFARPAGPSFAYAQIAHGGRRYSVRVWSGANASQEDQRALVRVIRSIDLAPED
ncbi:MAG TPA: hypothetical protein VML35_08210 [Gaiellaceae bacterium]|nr:hypothetical protein [Gaiellaceae bacterium]